MTVANGRDGGSGEGEFKESWSWLHAGNTVCGCFSVLINTGRTWIRAGNLLGANEPRAQT